MGRSDFVAGIDLEELGNNLDVIDRASIKRRKELYNRLYHEARISYEPGRGISFTNMLLLLAHHKIIVDNEALVYDFDSHELVIWCPNSKF